MNEIRPEPTAFFNLVEEIEDYAIIFLSPEGIISTWNKGAEKIKGYMSHEIIGNHFRVFYTREDQERGLPQQLIREAASSGRARYEGWRARKDGTLFWGNITLTAMLNESKELIGFTKITRDLTDNQLSIELQASKKHNEYLESKNSELEHFTYIASHDLQEPLNSIKSLAAVLRNKYAEKMDADGVACVNYIFEASNRMSARIRGLLDYSRLGKVREAAPVECLPLANEAVADLSQRLLKSGASIHIGKLPLVIGYESELKILFLNLISNAVKFRRNDRKIVVELTASYNDNCWLFSVRDNGIGIESGQEDKIFQIFHRLNPRDDFEGDGIGLSLCRKAVELHGGKIWVEQVPGGGCNFLFTIPDKLSYEKIQKS